MTNVIPQPLDKPFDRWTELEKYLTDLVRVQNKELYIITGRDGYTSKSISSKGINVPENVWKVVLVLDKSGAAISDVTKDTLAFGIYLPNTLDANNKGQDPNSDWTTNFSLLENGKEYGLFNVEQLEAITGYNFLSNIPTEIQEKIEGRNILGIRAMLNAIKPAPLLADGFPFSEIGTALDSAIGHDSIPNYIHGSTDSVVGNGSISKISTNENVMLTTIQKSSFTENSTDSTSLIQVTSNQISTSQVTPKQINTFQISIPDNRTIQSSFYQGSTKEIGSSQIGFTQTSETQIGSTEINISQDGTSEVNPVSPRSFASNNNSPSEVSLPGSVLFQQFFSGNFPSHNITSNFFSNLQYSANNLWSNLFDPTFNINLQNN
ncbi:MAG: DNA/RNA non-specific endonuclease [Nostoc sp. EspVER01]|nr:MULTISPECIES: DNA/RNA non-specific endonuclease [unclassified Nostoc]MDZ7943853.1 DNA/RNA non-specific endonuclease [Nostoc sp. EfeVER01]MDZ7996204.1 DNA/RNA non-specific endonuclease [Nostoc sp. EspVER01]